MDATLLREHIQKCKRATDKPFGVNIPLLYAQVEEQIKVIEEEDIKIVFTSAGSPALYTERFKRRNIKVVHVVSSVKFAVKAAQAGVDAIVAEGFEAGGHNGREETTTLVLIPAVCEAVHIPVIAAGGIGSGKAMAAVFALGAEAVQIGSLFAVSVESSAHDNFKKLITESDEGDTILTLKKLTPVRLLKNHFYEQIKTAEDNGASVEQLKNLLGKGRSRKGIFDGDLNEGELEIGQIAMSIRTIKPAAQIVDELWNEYRDTIAKLKC
jgi:enoyl-[acyl-carrier protein] reductase II